MNDNEDDVRELINKGRAHESIDDDFLDEDEGRRYIKYLDKALRLEPTNISIYLFKARVYKHMQMYNFALDNYQKYLDKDSNWIDDFLDISECYNQLGSNNQAKIFRDYYDDPAAYTETVIRGREYFDKKKSDEKSRDEFENFAFSIGAGILIAIILAGIIEYIIGVSLVHQSVFTGGITSVISLVIKNRNKMAIIGAIIGVIFGMGQQFPIYWIIYSIIIGTLTGYIIGGIHDTSISKGTVKVSVPKSRI